MTEKPQSTGGPRHGGRLTAAARQWQIPPEQWLDLSTGINPWGWPVPQIPAGVWRRLPEDDDGLGELIRHWAGAPAAAGCLPVAGSQAAIQALPWLRPQTLGTGAVSERPGKGRVGVPSPGYQEHGHCWAQAGYEVVGLQPDAIDGALEHLDVLVWIQPNNPSGLSLSVAQLLSWQARLAARGGWLVLDEAFIAAADRQSLAALSGREGLIVLRSLGKFFGLAGIRAGAVLAWPDLCQRLDRLLGPWAVSGPARYLMAQALQDLPWQQAMATQLRHASARLQDLLARYDLGPTGGTHLFQYVPHLQARMLADRLAREGILVRYFSAPAALRFGLPGEESEWQRLERALATLPVR